MTTLRPGQAAPPFHQRAVFGPVVRIPDPSGRAVALFFAPDLRSPSTGALLLRLQAALEAYEMAGVLPVLLTRSPLVEARDVVPRQHLLHPVLVDADGSLFERYGVSGGMGGIRWARVHVWLSGALAHLVRSGLGRCRRGLFHPAGAFLVDGQGRLVRSWRGGDPFDVPDPLWLLEGQP